MGLIEENVIAEPTTEEKLEATEQKVKHLCKNMFEHINNNHSLIWDLVWNNKLGFTPQEVIDTFGTDAKDLFELSDGIQTLAASACSDYVVKTTPNEYTVNPDGTVTIGEPR